MENHQPRIIKVPGNGQQPPESNIGSMMRRAATGPMTPGLAEQLLVKAADMIDMLGATMLRSKETMDVQAATIQQLQRNLEIAGEAITTKDALIEVLRHQVADLQMELAKAAEAVGEVKDTGGDE